MTIKLRGFMKKLSAFLALSLIVFVPALSVAAGSPKAQANKKDAAAQVDGLAKQVIALFPRAEGKVADADEKTVTLDMGSESGLKPGMEVLLFRPGQAIRHPVTKVILGYHETALGKAVLTQVGEKESKGEIKELLVTRIIKGDTARLPDEKAKLLLAVYGKDYNERVLDRLAGQLRDSGRFDITGPVEIPKDPALDGDKAKALAAEDKVQDILAVSTAATKKADRTKVGLTLFSDKGETLTSADEVVDSSSGVFEVESEGFPLVKGEHRDYFYTEDLPFRARLMAGGNITGGGKTEFAVSDGRRIVVYRLEQGGLKELWSEAESSSNGHLSLDCADLNGNGRDEIYVTNFIDGRMSSYVIEYDGKNFVETARDMPVAFRVLDVPGSGKRLITGTVGSSSPWSGLIREYAWKDGRLVDVGRFPLPSRIKDPYGFLLADLVPDKKPGTKPGVKPERKDGAKDPLSGLEVVWVDDTDHIQVMNQKGKTLWKSSERYGGYDNFFEVDPKSFTVQNVDNRGKVKGRLFLKEGPEGEKQIILTKNKALTNVVRRWKGYSGAEIYSFTWNGQGLDERWSIKNIEGYLADIFMGDASNQGRSEIAIITDPTYKMLKKSKSLPMGAAGSLLNSFKDKSSLLVYRVPQR